VVEIRNAANQIVSITATPSDGVARADVSATGVYYGVAVARGGQGNAGQYLLDAAIQPTTSLNFADLAIASITAPTNAASGQTVSFTWAVGNYGAVATAGNSWVDRIVLSENDRFGDQDDNQIALAPHSGVLNAGAFYTNQMNVPLPLGLSGTFFVFIKTDAANTVPEFIFEANNVRAANTNLVITLTPYGDLAASNVSAPRSLLPDKTRRFRGLSPMSGPAPPAMGLPAIRSAVGSTASCSRPILCSAMRMT
jgi:hypothetical protein